MKRLFLFLCLANVVYLFWQFHIGRLNPQSKNPIVSSSVLLVGEYQNARRGAEIARIIDQDIQSWQVKEIQWMLADLKNEQWKMKPMPVPAVKKVVKPKETKPEAKPEKPVIQTVEKKCFEVGPFADEDSVKIWLNQAVLSGQKIIQKDVQVPNDYQVYYPAAKTEEDSRINKMLLNAKGVQEIWRVPSGDLKGAYSLGVFKEKQRALVLQSQLAEKEIQAKIKQRDKLVPQWFAIIKLEKNKVKQYESPEAKFSSCSAN